MFNDGSWTAHRVGLYSLRASFAIELLRHFDLLISPAFDVLTTDDERTGLGPPWGTIHLSSASSIHVRAWPGISGGLSIPL